MAKFKFIPAKKQAHYRKTNASKVKERDIQRKKVQRVALKENPKQWQQYRAKENE